MLEDSLLNFADATSYSYMYMTGRAWSAGDVALPGRINQRIIIGGVEASPEHEFRTIDGGSWWRIRGGDGWHTGVAPAMEMHVIGPRTLHSNLKALISGAKNLQLKSSQSMATPLETVIDTHYLSGVTTVGSIREIGLGTVGDPAETQLVDFEFWIHQDTGMPARILFHGVPPALPPLGILHLFEVDKLHPESIAAPPPEALTENIGLVAASRQAVVTPPDDPGDEGARREVDSAGSEQSESTDPPARGADNGPQGAGVYVESVPGDRPKWLLLVVPTDGYSVGAPGSWKMDEASDFLDLRAPDGLRLQVRRHPIQGSLFDAGQQRLEDLRASEERYGTVSATLLTIRSGESMRVDFGDTESATSVVEYIVARAPLGESGPVYRLTFSRDSGAPAAGDDALISEIIESFTLLGAVGEH